LSHEAEYDLQMERAGWYRTVRVAEILHINPLWLAYAVECDMMKARRGSGKRGEAMHVRIRLADAEAWQARIGGESRRGT
jgi:hypothetical protein